MKALKQTNKLWSCGAVDRNGCKNFRTNQPVKGAPFLHRAVAQRHSNTADRAARSVQQFVATGDRAMPDKARREAVSPLTG
jgi:hypothetical protein